MGSTRRRIGLLLLVTGALLLATARSAPGQELPAATSQTPVALSLADAFSRAERTSPAIAIAQAGLDLADVLRVRATVDRLPRVGAYSSYDRLLRSEFQGMSLPPSEAGEELDLPFGNRNTYRAGLQVAHTVLAGGRGVATSRAAASAGRASELDLASTRAAVMLDVVETYFDAALTRQLLAIAELTQAQAESSVVRATSLLQVGKGSEFEYLRARVSRDRHRPAVLRRRADHDVAMLRLQQLVHSAATETLMLTTPLDVASAEAFPAAARLAASQANGLPLAVRSAAERVLESEQRLAAARSQRFPTVTAFSTYEGVSYAGRRLPTAQDFRANWTVGGRIDMPLFAGRGMADEAEARAHLGTAHAEQQQAERRAAFDARVAVTQLAVAEAAFAASDASVREAARAYDIALLRHDEGMSIQLELDDARIALEESRAEQARATRDVLVERFRAALLPALPPGRALAR